MQKCTAQDCNIFIFRIVVRCNIIFDASWKDNDRSLVRFFLPKRQSELDIVPKRAFN